MSNVDNVNTRIAVLVLAALSLAALSLATLSLGGCAPGAKQTAENLEKKYFVLSAQRVAAPQSGAPALEGALKVKRATISQSYAGRNLVYRTGENTYVSDYYNMFFSAPADMLSQAAREWMRQANLFDNVLVASSDMRPQYVLEASVTSLYGDFSQSGAPKAVLAMQFFLLKDDSLNYEMTLHTEYARETPLASQTPEALAAAWNQGLADILAELEQDLAGLSP